MVGLESTVVSLLPGEPARLLRPGGVTREAIEAMVGTLETAEDDAKRSPGRLALHYAPDAPVRLNVTTPNDDEAYLGFGPGSQAGCARPEPQSYRRLAGSGGEPFHLPEGR